MDRRSVLQHDMPSVKCLSDACRARFVLHMRQAKRLISALNAVLAVDVTPSPHPYFALFFLYAAYMSHERDQKICLYFLARSDAPFMRVTNTDSDRGSLTVLLTKDILAGTFELPSRHEWSGTS